MIQLHFQHGPIKNLILCFKIWGVIEWSSWGWENCISWHGSWGKGIFPGHQVIPQGVAFMNRATFTTMSQRTARMWNWTHATGGMCIEYKIFLLNIIKLKCCVSVFLETYFQFQELLWRHRICSCHLWLCAQPLLRRRRQGPATNDVCMGMLQFFNKY